MDGVGSNTSRPQQTQTQTHAQQHAHHTQHAHHAQHAQHTQHAHAQQHHAKAHKGTGHSKVDSFTPHGAVKGASPKPLSSVNANDATLQKLANGRLHTGADHSCVTTTLSNMGNLGVDHPVATGNDTGNNPRGAMSQMIQNGWTSVSTPSSTTETINSAYGSVQAAVIPASEYSQLAQSGQIPSGAVVFQTRHDSWNDNSPGSRGFDMGIARDGGATTFNYQANPSLVYQHPQSVVVLVPNSAVQ
jgi:hypothetical protein